MPDSRENTHFFTLPTEDVGEVAALLRVNEDKIRGSTVLTAGTTLQAFMSSEAVPKDDALSRGFGSYILTQPGPKQDGYHTYYFAKPKTDAQKEVPFRSTPRTQDVTWDAVLLDLHGGLVNRAEFNQTETEFLTGYVNKTARTRIEFQDRYQLIPQITYPTHILVEEFQSATPWETLEATRPVPTQVRYFYRGTQLSISALHDDVTIPADTEDFTRDDRFGMPNAMDLPEGQFFPATVPKKWQVYTFADNQEFRNGLYYRKRERIVKLPPLPKAMRF